MTENLGCVVDQFLVHKRTLGRKYVSEEAELELLLRFAEEHHVDRLDQLTAGLLDEFFASRPRSRPRSFNHLLGVVRSLLDWAVTYEMLQTSPLRTQRRRATTARIPFVFDLAAARRLLEAAAALPDNERARQRGPTYRTIFALCYGLGLRAGEVCGLRLGDVDPQRDLLVVRGGKFGKTRLVPYGPQIGELIAEMTSGGRILLTSSISARFAAYHHTLYAASKAAVSAMVLNLAPELAERGIAINAIAPGGTNTDMARENAAEYTHPALVDVPPDALLKSRISLGRLAEPDEIAATAAFLLSSDASYVTGSTMDVSGGM